jgi:hypothetical protein
MLARPSQSTVLSNATLVLTSGRRKSDSVGAPPSPCESQSDVWVGSFEAQEGFGSIPKVSVVCGTTLKSLPVFCDLPIRTTPRFRNSENVVRRVSIVEMSAFGREAVSLSAKMLSSPALSSKVDWMAGTRMVNPWRG